jgi:predicted short-subunit dehydrogenase-like oxidoreductase (DUF2520 family)
MAKTCSILGSGNVAWHFSRLLLDAGYNLREIYIRNEANDIDFAPFGNIKKVRNITDISPYSDFYFFCVSDDAINTLVESFPFNPTEFQICLHTSGSVPVSVFSSLCKRYGSIWPLQTLKKSVIPLYPDYPLFINASDPQTENILYEVGTSLAHTCIATTETQKAEMHLAAVMTGNFINHLLSSGFDYCFSNQLEFAWLRSLIMETVQKSLHSPDPSLVQTGPASRHDIKTLERHMEMLKDEKPLRELYQILSESIMTKHPRK